MEPESDKRVDLAVTVLLLGFIFIQTIMASIMPKGENTSRLSTYTRIVASLALSIFNLAMCCILRLHWEQARVWKIMSFDVARHSKTQSL